MNTRVRSLSAALVMLLLTAASATTAGESKTSPHESAMVRIPGHVLPALAKATKVEPRGNESNQPMTLTIVLKRDNQAGFDKYLKEIYDPHSKNFHRYFSQSQIADRFGPSQQSYDAALAYLRGNGFNLIQGSANRLTLTIRGTRAQTERAMSMKIGEYRIGDRTFYANEEDPAMPTDQAVHVESITGLSNLARVNPTYLWSLLPNCPKDDAPQFGGNIDKAKYYCEHGNTNGYNGPKGSVDPPLPSWLGYTGAGQTIALIEFDTFSKSDVSDYLALTAAPASTINQVSQVHLNGGATLGPNEAEVLVDVDSILNNAPGASVVVYDSPFTGGKLSVFVQCGYQRWRHDYQQQLGILRRSNYAFRRPEPRYDFPECRNGRHCDLQWCRRFGKHLPRW